MAGNPLDRDGDGTGGEPVDDALTDAFTLTADVTPPTVQTVTVESQAPGAFNFDVDQLRIVFSEAMDAGHVHRSRDRRVADHRDRPGGHGRADPDPAGRRPGPQLRRDDPGPHGGGRLHDPDRCRREPTCPATRWAAPVTAVAFTIDKTAPVVLAVSPDDSVGGPFDGHRSHLRRTDERHVAAAAQPTGEPRRCGGEHQLRAIARRQPLRPAVPAAERNRPVHVDAGHGRHRCGRQPAGDRLYFHVPPGARQPGGHAGGSLARPRPCSARRSASPGR